MRRAIVDQVMMLMFIFVFLVTIFFLVIDYSSVGKVQNQLDMLTREGSRLISLGKGEDKVANMVNILKTNYYQSVTSDDINCIEDTTKSTNRVVFTVLAPFHSRFDAIGESGEVNVSSTSIAYNEWSNNEINCTVVLQKGAI